MKFTPWWVQILLLDGSRFCLGQFQLLLLFIGNWWFLLHCYRWILWKDQICFVGSRFFQIWFRSNLMSPDYSRYLKGPDFPDLVQIKFEESRFLVQLKYFWNRKGEVVDQEKKETMMIKEEDKEDQRKGKICFILPVIGIYYNFSIYEVVKV